MRTVNAVITGTTLGPEGHGILSAILTLDYGDGTAQGFGGYNLTRCCGTFVRRVLEVAGVDCWEKLAGRAVRVKREDGFNGRAVRLGHYIRDDWFDPMADCEAEAAVAVSR